MALVKPFRSIRPVKELAGRIAALPYDVYNREEAKKETLAEPLSFLAIDRAETQLGDHVSTYDDIVYDKARQLLEEMIEQGNMFLDEDEAYYIYQLTMDGRSQSGIVACSSIDDYLDGTIKKHEKTRQDKEIDRIKHVDALNAQTGPIFLAYRAEKVIDDTVAQVQKEEPIYSFDSADGVGHKVWKVTNADKIKLISDAFDKIDNTYIADGHHRTASAVKVGLKRREENPGYVGDEEFNFFLSVLFPHNQLMIMPYNRAVKDLNGLTVDEFFDAIKGNFNVKLIGKEAYSPLTKGEFGMYIDDNWYCLNPKEELNIPNDPVSSLDVSILQDYLLQPILAIEDPRTDNRIDFIGGIRGLNELERRVEGDMKVAFSMYPTSIDELLDVADADMLMPPKSTWFEPKLRSGLFIHSLE